MTDKVLIQNIHKELLTAERHLERARKHMKVRHDIYAHKRITSIIKDIAYWEREYREQKELAE